MRLVLTFLLAAAFQDSGARPAGNREALVAFRFDAQHVVATVKSDLDVSLPQLARNPVPRPIAKYGFPIFDLPPTLRGLVPSWMRPGDRWTIHAGPGQTFSATAERIVLGEAGCSHLMGLLLKVDDTQADAFAGVRAKYYTASAEPRTTEAPATTLGELPASTLTNEARAAIDKALAALLGSELPRVRADAREAAGRAATTAESQRAWMRRVLDSHEALARGDATLAYDAQPYRLMPDGGPMIFVRATWRAAGRQAFAVALWLRADTGEIVWKDLRPASWIGTWEFHRGVATEHLGLVLNVVDSDGDGWAEVIFAQLGYESVRVSRLDVRSAFAPAGTGYHYGC